MDIDVIVKIKAIALFIIAFLNLLLVLLIWSRGKTKATLHLGIMAFFSSIFALTIGGVYFYWEVSQEIQLFFVRASWLGVLMLPSFISFVYYFTEKTKFLKIKSLVLYLIGAIIPVLALTTPFLAAEGNFYIKHTFIRGGKPGFLDPFARIYIFICLVIILVNLLKYYLKTTKYKRLQIKYFILGTATYAGGGIITTALVPLFLKDTIVYIEVAAFLSFVWIGLTTYTIFTKRLFGIKIILTEILVGVLIIISAVLPFLIKSYNLKILSIIIFFLLCVIGYLLIWAVYKEVWQREQLEKLNEDLKKAYEQEKKDKQRIKEMGEKLLETERKIKEDIIEETEQTRRRFNEYFMRDLNLENLKLKQKILELAYRVKELEKELEKAQRGRRRKT